MEVTMRAKSPGWRRSLPDFRDETFRFKNALKEELTPSMDFPLVQRPQMREVDKQPVLDQGQCSGCTGFGTASMVAVERNVSPRSATAIYYGARLKIGEQNLDNGAYGRDAVAIAVTDGVPRDDLWPNDLGPNGVPTNLFIDPGAKADADALKRKSFTYHPLSTRQEMRSCLQRHTFCIGVTCFSNLWDARVTATGLWPFPAGQDQGGHWIWIIGADFDFRNSEWAQWARNQGYPDAEIENEVYIGQNSWGRSWGRQGRFVIPARILESPYFADDGQTLRGFSNENR
jgi:hypothetical protein